MTDMKTFEFTAFTEADLLDAGAEGGGLSCGDVFAMPGAATLCFEVTDNDCGLSGDNWNNENANDHYGQQASIIDAATGDEVGNGGQIYAEKYWCLMGSDGRYYYLIEIEQENGDAPGAGDDYFTFFGSVPSEGVELTVVGGGNICGDWLSYKYLDAGEKAEPDGKICVEAEDLELYGYRVEHQDAASGDELIKLACNTGYAKLADFKGETCFYDISITVVDENDGQGFLDVFVDGALVGSFKLDQDDGGNGYCDVKFRTLTIEDIEIPQGAEITLKGRGDHGEYVRIDKICFDKVETPLGSIAGRYFCDVNRDDVDNDEPGVNGVTVTLVDLDSGETWTTVTRTIDGVEGAYSFTGLEEGRYQVVFAADPTGKTFVAANDPNGNGDDTNDSDAVLNSDGTASSQIISLGAGEDVADIDAGVENLAPVAADDEGMVCYDDLLTIDVRDNDSDANGDALTVVAINGEAFGADGQVVLANGVVISLAADGSLVVDGENAVIDGVANADLLFGETATDSFIYTVADGNGGEASATVTIDYKGATDTLEKIDAEIGGLIASGTLTNDKSIGGAIFGLDFVSFDPADDPFAQRLDAIAGGGEIDLTFCLSIATPIEGFPVVNTFTVDVLDEASYLAATQSSNDVGDFPTGPNSDDGGFNGANVDNVNWLLNEAEDLLAEGFTQGNIQRAIWNLLDGGPNSVLEGDTANFFFSQNPEFETAADALELTNRALNDGEGFVAGAGDKVGLVLSSVDDGVQPLVIAVDFDTLVFDCVC